MRFAFLSCLLLMLAACAGDQASFTPVSFSDLSGWQQDKPSHALVAFQHSCIKLTARSNADKWRAACAAAEETAATDQAARVFFESAFVPYAVAGSNGDEGTFTGYYMPELRGALKRKGPYQTPLYARPKDLVSSDLGTFKNALKGEHVVGKVEEQDDRQNYVPYDDRAAIAQGSLKGRAKPLAWTSDPIGAFFMEIQGSGLLKLPNGKTMPIGYDGTNGRAYVAIGHILADRGEIDRPITMQKIRNYLAAHPKERQEIFNENPSYIFFRCLPNKNAIGAEGVPLTATRSLAVDPSHLPLGAPIWLDTEDGQGHDLKRLMVAQDTGGAIKGVVRGDFFWGAGAKAGEQAGAMQSRGRYFILLPKNMTPDDCKR